MGWKVTTETNDSDKVTSILGEAFQYYADGSIVELDRSLKEDLFFILYISATKGVISIRVYLHLTLPVSNSSLQKSTYSSKILTIFQDGHNSIK